MVQQAVNRKACQADIRIEDDQAAGTIQSPPSLPKKRRGRLQMVKHVEQNQMRKTRGREREFVAIAHQIKPGVWKEVRANGGRIVRLEIANAGSDLQHGAGNRGVDQLYDPVIKPRVDRLEQRLRLPELQVFLNFSLMLVEFLQAKNFKRRAANQTIRSNNQPCFQREILVSP